MSFPRLPRFLLAAIAVGLVIAGVVAWRSWQGPVVEVATVASRPLKQTVVVSGRVLAPAKTDIGATITGRVQAVKVDEGDRVAAGQVLVELESGELAAALAQARATESSAATRILQWRDVGVPQAREALAQAEANLRSIERDAERQEQLFKQGFIGAARVDEARRGLAVANSQYQTARAQATSNTATGAERRQLEDQLAQARAAREVAAAKLAQTTLRAPAAGTVLDRSVEPGDIVQPGKRLLTLALDGPARLTALIDEKNLGLLRIGEAALVSADAYPEQRFRAALSYLAPAIDVARGTVESKFDVPAPPAFLRADMTVSIDLVVADRAQALVVPAAAVRDAAGDAPWVLTASEGRTARTPVRLGARSACEVELVSGAPAGTVVVLAPDVAPGTRVRAAPAR
jgi:HlyD family secretion protein